MDSQFVLERIHSDLKNATLGYALMTLMDHNDMGRGPRLVTQTINPRPINLKYAKNFKRSVRQKGLQNRKVENAIIVGVEKTWLEDSCLEPMHEGVYTKVVAWTKSQFRTEKAILFNGNHRLNYMKTEDPCRFTHFKYCIAKDNLEKCSKKEEKQQHKDVMDQAEKIIREQGVWLVRFIDLGESAQVYQILVHN